MNRILLVALIATGCATTPSGLPSYELKQEPGKNATFRALGAEYSVPPDLKVPAITEWPGGVEMQYVDQITGCKGWVLFKTNASKDTHDKRRRELLDGERQEYGARGLKVDEQLGPTQGWLGTDARVTLLTVSDSSDKAEAGYSDVHLPDQLLSLSSYGFCSDVGLYPATMKTLSKVVNSQRRGETPGTAVSMEKTAR
jgi:hypothetical protein